jgi:hypothetical protein
VIWAALIPAWLKRAAGWLVAGLAAVAGIWGLSKRDARRGAALDAAKQEMKAHERINKADVGAGLSDSDRVKRLRDYAKRHGN